MAMLLLKACTLPRTEMQRASPPNLTTAKKR